MFIPASFPFLSKWRKAKLEEGLVADFISGEQLWFMGWMKSSTLVVLGVWTLFYHFLFRVTPVSLFAIMKFLLFPFSNK